MGGLLVGFAVIPRHVRRRYSKSGVSSATLARMINVEIAGRMGVISYMIASQTLTGSVLLRTPLMNSVTTTSSKDTLNAKSAPPNTARRIWGNVTRKNVRIGPAPRLWDASSSEWSKPSSARVTRRTTNGKARTLCARMRPAMVPTMPTWENTKYAATANTMLGTMRAEISDASSTVRQRDRIRTSPSAASVPSTVATTVVPSATWTERARASIHSGLAKKRRYWVRPGA